MSSATWAVVAAAFIGAATTPVGIILTHWLKNRRSSKLDNERKKLLKNMLIRPEWPWRSLTRLAHVIGADEDTTKRLLLESGARGDENGQPKWSLISRVGLPGES